MNKSINRFVVYLLLLGVCPSLLFAQSPVSKLKPKLLVLEKEIQFSKTKQMARNRVRKKPLDNRKILENLGYEKIVGKYERKLELRKPKPSSTFAEHELTIKYQKELINLFREVDRVEFFLPQPFEVPSAPHNGVPVRFVENQGKTCLLITGATVETVFDTSETTSKTRAARVLTSHVLPVLEMIDKAFRDADIAYYGMIIGYNRRDYSKHTLFAQAEVLCIIVSKEDLRKLKEGKITKTAFLDKSYLFVSDEDMKEGFQRVKQQKRR